MRGMAGWRYSAYDPGAYIRTTRKLAATLNARANAEEEDMQKEIAAGLRHPKHTAYVRVIAVEEPDESH